MTEPEDSEFIGEPKNGDRYAILFIVKPRTSERFTKEEIELAARVSFFNAFPDGWDVMQDEEVVLDWAEEFTTGEKMIRVHARLRKNHSEAEDASQEGPGNA